ncbi:hypothetical protein SDC9_73914 [bioreactor metagenome]|uniref:Lipoprotein n=1 Tax=bioreactor metagenome TaxID=1076179 RepID=A0A644YLN8_9ZZZZ
MKYLHLLLLTLIIAIVASCGNNDSKTGDSKNIDSTQVRSGIPYDTAATSMAQLIAGITPEDTTGGSAIVQKTIWKIHADSIRTLFNTAEKKNLGFMRQWAAAELPEGRDTAATLLYAFSGPDYLYANTFYPGAKKYILFGLEPVGKIPVLDTTKNQELFFNAIRRSLKTSLSRNFFITLHMSGDLRASEYNGVTSILMLYAAYTGHKIKDISYVSVDTNGRVLPCAYDSLKLRNETGGVRLNLIDSLGREKEVTYFSFNAENSLFEKCTVKKYLESIDGKTFGMLKAASYLMHYDGFMKIREIFTSKVSVLLTDDTGLSYRTMKSVFSKIQLYGKYSNPVDMFDYINLHDLQLAYDSLPAKPIRFTYGYGYGQKLMIGRK